MSRNATVYDLDGTLVRLDVDWQELAVDAVALAREQGVDVPDDVEFWSLFDAADDRGFREELESLVGGRERRGARDSRRLPHADELVAASDPVAVCSLNCEAACRVALETHGLEDHVDAVVGRDTVSTWKPDPEPLLAALRAVDASPDRAEFVGDSERDEVTARRAGVAFRWVE